ncbi:hypothetical protein ELH06_08520 [Rhizobium ruizarguesonis]|uniref:hypothetical protein n=1 Tax=Rhizobium ruizarguesonis TaxID=2081791 RepID=UPI00102F4C63|nr:hypothetical protein [Rhizobium ruizarguesonis]TBE49201.1 hypothetical protein ELH06_08520 [Rhizobium ruizarguesonis]
MTTKVFIKLQVTATRLITKYGQAGTIRRIAPPDPVTGGDGTPTDYPCRLFPATYDRRYVDGTNILASDKQLYIGSIGIAVSPKVGDLAIGADGTEYHIIADDPQNYDGVVNVVYIVQGRTV